MATLEADKNKAEGGSDELLSSVLSSNDVAKISVVLQQLTKCNTKKNYNVLHMAAQLGHIGVLKWLLLHPAAPQWAMDVSEEGWRPLMTAVTSQNVFAVLVLLESGYCDINLTDSNGDNVLHLAAENIESGNTVVMTKALLKACTEIDARNIFGMTPFRKSVEFNNEEFAHCLFCEGCCIDIPCVVQGRTALHAAIMNGFENMVIWLLKKGANVNAQDKNLQTPLMLCVHQKRDPHVVFKMMRLIIDFRANLNMQDSNGNSALLIALGNPFGVRKHHIELLLVSGADPNISNNDGLTPIWQTVYVGSYCMDRMSIIQLLIEENCYLNESCRGKMLFQCGSDCVYCYETLVSPFEVAMDSRLYNAAKLLLLAGCQVKADMRYDSHTPAVPEELIWFKELTANPHSLQHESRLVIRKVLGAALQSKVRKLPLPEKLKEYLLLHDIFKR